MSERMTLGKAFGEVAGDVAAYGPVLDAIGEPRRVRDLIANVQATAREARPVRDTTRSWGRE
jgi:hypothetical protein